MARFLYTIALVLLAPLVLVRLWWRALREPGYRLRIGERFGYYREGRGALPLLWVHAVSVGEARASAMLVQGLAAEHPGHELLLTCTTAAGREMLRELHGDSVRIAWLPYDAPGPVRRFLEQFRPRCGLLVETEIWPNLLEACRRNGVPVVLANARLSEGSARGYGRLAALVRPAVASLSLACAQTEEDAERLRALGARRVEVTGNLKFDAVPDETKQAAGRAWRAHLARPVLLLASTREGEEKMLLEALPAWDGNLLVLVVPRHARRFDEVAGLSHSRRSRTAHPAPGDHVHLGDTMGEMDFYYAAADVALIGGSFVPRGGQNLIEACAAGVPVVLGPSMVNFAEAARLAVAAGAARQADGAAAAMQEVTALLADARARASMGDAGRELCRTHRGATRRHLDLCREVLRAPARG
jgi:3-deoxy-D-manno-octulosonic-acid transferase